MDMARAAISQLKPFYRSGESNIGQDFFFLCISYCSSYSRAVGFFSSSTLITWAKILPELVAREKASIRLLISPQLPESDRNALQEIVHPEERDRFIQRWVSTIIQEATKFAETPSDSTLRIRLFLWLVATGRLEIRIAFPQHIEQPGIFHEKIGVFQFPWGVQVAFTGSANETSMGHTKNYESIDVYRSWVAEDADRVQIKAKQFEDAWFGGAWGLRTLPLSAETISYITATAPPVNPLDEVKPATHARVPPLR
ncbi:helicase-like [Dehalococcoides mccartyi]|uniref:Helicase-like n=1 Tax=Dehalococcoides mccartyi TaxID=61435 RepID=A0A328EQJ0_9CHLR|nr:helicase-like [Dehalococcoides mccartyi]